MVRFLELRPIVHYAIGAMLAAIAIAIVHFLI